jgi:phosphoribosylaminoimidazole carboxylase
LNRELSSVCDVMTVEIEHVNTEILDVLVKEGKQIHPKPSTIRMIQVLPSNISHYFKKFPLF